MNNLDIRSPVFITYLFLSLLVGVPFFFLLGKSFVIPLIIALVGSFLLISLIYSMPTNHFQQMGPQ